MRHAGDGTWFEENAQGDATHNERHANQQPAFHKVHLRSIWQNSDKRGDYREQIDCRLRIVRRPWLVNILPGTMFTLTFESLLFYGNAYTRAYLNHQTPG